MLKNLGQRLWNTNPLWIIGVVLFVQYGAFANGNIPISLLPTTLLVMGLAYLQNTTYSLLSRSANRNSNAYHAFAALAANFTFFWSLQLLVRNNLPPALLAPYVFATILGTLHGNAISMKIESALGLSAEGANGRPQLMKLWPTVAVLMIALVLQAQFLSSSFSYGLIVGLMILTVVEGFAFSLLRVARSTDHYWFHFGAVVLNLGVSFLRLSIMVNNRYDWALFLPTTTGSIIGSLVGASIAQDVGKKIKAAFDSHIADDVKILWPARQFKLLGVALLVHCVVFGIAGYKAGLILLAMSIWQAVSSTMVSRARQRNNAQYLAWTSVFSNGVWYLCMHYLTQGAITAEKAAPYIVGNAGGSLVGQNLAMRVEQITGALTDGPSKQNKSTIAIA